MEERPLPPPPKGLSVVLVILFSLLSIGGVLLWMRHPLDFFHPLPGILAFALLVIPLAVIRYFYFNRRRCPECGNHLVLRRDPVEGKPWRHRMMLDCPRCQIAWNTGDIEDDVPSA